MARIEFIVTDVYPPSSSGAAPDEIGTTLRRCLAFDASSDESGIICYRVPSDFRGDGTLKLALPVAANTSTATHGVYFEAVTEHITPDAGTPEAVNADAFDASADAGTVDFSTTAYGLKVITITLTPATTPVAGDLGRVKVTRKTANAADDLTSDCYVLLDGLAVYEEV